MFCLSDGAVTFRNALIIAGSLPTVQKSSRKYLYMLVLAYNDGS